MTAKMTRTQQMRVAAIDWPTEIAKMQQAFTRANHSAGMAARSMTRGLRQRQRNILTRPLSPERREIQAIGRREMAEAIAWFKASIEPQQERE